MICVEIDPAPPCVEVDEVLMEKQAATAKQRKNEKYTKLTGEGRRAAPGWCRGLSGAARGSGPAAASRAEPWARSTAWGWGWSPPQGLLRAAGDGSGADRGQCGASPGSCLGPGGMWDRRGERGVGAALGL